MSTTFALHRITDPADLPFSAAGYSRFKFGDGRLATAFGDALGRAFVAAHGDALLDSEQTVYVPSPYDAIPTASFAMAEAFKDALNLFLYRHGKASLLSSKIHRYKTYTTDYGNLSHEERLRLISSDATTWTRAFYRAAPCFFWTISASPAATRPSSGGSWTGRPYPGRFFFLYYASLDNPAVAPNFENYLNYYEITGIREIVALFNEPYFALNTRVIKYILKGAPEDVTFLLNHAPAPQLKLLIAYALGNNYHLIADYRTNLNTLIQATDYGH